jgi:Holliday junction resolvase-like predicted endonuclease
MSWDKAKINEDGTRETPIRDSQSRKGDLAEYYAVTWLWDNGYEVFKNASSCGPIDMIASKDGEFKLIDVKTSDKNGKVQDKRTNEQISMGVVFLLFNKQTRKCRFVEHLV